MATANALLSLACTNGFACLNEMQLLQVIAQGAMTGGGGDGGGGMAIGGAVTSGTQGSVLFIGPGGTLAQDNANFFWDDTNNRLGLGTNGPAYPLEVIGSGSDLQLNLGNIAGRFSGMYFSRSGTLVSQFFYDNTANLTAFTSVVANASLGFSAGATGFGNQLTILASGNVGIGTTVTTPTAVLHLKAGTAAASTAPIKLTAGTALTVVELGAIEYVDDGTTGHFFGTVNVAGVPTRKQLDN